MTLITLDTLSTESWTASWCSACSCSGNTLSTATSWSQTSMAGWSMGHRLTGPLPTGSLMSGFVGTLTVGLLCIVATRTTWSTVESGACSAMEWMCRFPFIFWSEQITSEPVSSETCFCSFVRPAFFIGSESCEAWDLSSSYRWLGRGGLGN